MIKLAKPRQALTFVELIMTVGIFLILVAITLPMISSTLLRQQLAQADRQLVHVLRKAQSQASTQYKVSAWGVQLDSAEGEYILFSGDSYATRDPLNDIEYQLPSSVSFSSISLNGGGSELVFTQAEGETEDYGTIELSRGDEVSTITVDALGYVRKD